MPIDAKDVNRAALAAAGNCLDHCLDVIWHCVDQLSEEQIWWRPAPEMNSIGNLLLHLEGNLRQWIVSGLLGGSDARNRPAEFSADRVGSKTELFEHLSKAVAEAKGVLAGMSVEEMLSERKIQGFCLNGWAAVFDSLPHFKGHAQEIVSLTRQQKGDAYRFRWTPQSPEQGAATD